MEERDIFVCASENDVEGIQRLLKSGVNVNTSISIFWFEFNFFFFFFKLCFKLIFKLLMFNFIDSKNLIDIQFMKLLYTWQPGMERSIR